MGDMAKYTPKVMTLAQEIRVLTVGELLALNETLKGYFDVPPPPDIGVREPREPIIPQGGLEAFADDDE